MLQSLKKKKEGEGGGEGDGEAGERDNQQHKFKLVYFCVRKYEKQKLPKLIYTMTWFDNIIAHRVFLVE